MVENWFQGDETKEAVLSRIDEGDGKVFPINMTGSYSSKSPALWEKNTGFSTPKSFLPMRLRLMNVEAALSREKRSDTMKLAWCHSARARGWLGWAVKETWLAPCTSICPLFLLIVYAIILEVAQGRGGLTGFLASAMLITCKTMYAWF